MSFWVLQGNRDLWDRPETFYTEPTLGWSVPGIQEQIAPGDGVLIWLASRRPSLRGVYAAGLIVGPAREGYPSGWGTERQRAQRTWFAPLAIHWYLSHNPVSVEELRTSAFSTNRILRMARRTAYSCTEAEFRAAIELADQHGPTPTPTAPAMPFDTWWGSV